MSIDLKKFSGLELEYDSGSIPPPFSHVYRLGLDWSKGDLESDFVIHYTDREELSEEEIYGEGFSLEDDYSAKVKLNSIWKEVVFEKLKSTKWNSRSLKDEGISLALLEGRSALAAKVPVDQEGWKLLGQDLIQAIYESNKKEAPLSIRFKVVTKEIFVEAQITVYFSNRRVRLEANEKVEDLNWEFAIELMKLIFTPDYNYEIARDQPGNKRGIYLDCGDGYWHVLGKGVTNVDREFDAVGRIEKALMDMI